MSAIKRPKPTLADGRRLVQIIPVSGLRAVFAGRDGPEACPVLAMALYEEYCETLQETVQDISGLIPLGICIEPINGIDNFLGYADATCSVDTDFAVAYREYRAQEAERAKTSREKQ